jgi:hypothetical protein
VRVRIANTSGFLEEAVVRSSATKFARGQKFSEYQTGNVIAKRLDFLI